jgi:hypothetical protein
MIIYNVFIPFYSKKSIKTPFGALIFQKFDSSYGWLILARVRVLYVPNGYGSFLCLVYATTVVIYYLADFVHIWYNGWV